MPNTVQTLMIKNKEFCRKMYLKVLLFLTLSRATLDFSGLVWCLGLNLPQVFATSATCFRALNIYILIQPLRQNLKSLNRVTEPSITSSNWAPTQISKHLLNFRWTNHVWTTTTPCSNSLITPLIRHFKLELFDPNRIHSLKYLRYSRYFVATIKGLNKKRKN